MCYDNGGSTPPSDSPAIGITPVGDGSSPAGPGGTTTGDNDSPGESEEDVKQANQIKCNDATRSAASGLSECRKVIKNEKAKVHHAVCSDEGQRTGSVSVSIAGKIITGLLGFQLTKDDYTICFNQLNLNADAILEECQQVHDEFIEAECKGV